MAGASIWMLGSVYGTRARGLAFAAPHLHGADLHVANDVGGHYDTENSKDNRYRSNCVVHGGLLFAVRAYPSGHGHVLSNMSRTAPTQAEGNR
jgi:hypothetical protein